MKLISTTLGRFIVATFVVLVILICIASILLPNAKDFVLTSIPVEENYSIRQESVRFTLESSKAVWQLNVNAEVDIFNGITALSPTGDDLLSQLKDDYNKPVEERELVFVYKINKDGYPILAEKIDSSKVGEWKVIYVLKDGLDYTSLKVSFCFMK